MGFYLGSELKNESTEDLSPTITVGEYVSTLLSVVQNFPGHVRPRCHRERMGVLYLTTDRPERAAEMLSGLVERLPNDASAHRLLGIAYLNQRKFGVAVKHFEIALGLLRREAATERGLYDALRIQCQAALLRLLLVQLHVRLGHAEAARFLVEEGRTL